MDKYRGAQSCFEMLKYCLGLFLLSRIVIYALAYWGNVYLPHLQPFPEWFFRLDSINYLNIAQHGYDTALVNIQTMTAANQAAHFRNYAFFPLYPLLIKAVDFFSPYSVINGQIISQISFLGCLILFYMLLQHYFDEKTCRFGVLLLAFCPFNIYFSSAYTESIYLFLSLAAWLAMLRKNWLCLGLFGCLLALTRPTGILLFAPGLLAVLEDWKQTHQFNWRFIYLLLIPAGTMLFMFYLWRHVGDPLAFLHAEQAWGRLYVPPGITALHLPVYLLIPDYLVATIKMEIPNFLVCLITVFLCKELYKKRFYKECLFLILTILAGIGTGTFLSVGRFIEGNFVFYFAWVLIGVRIPKLQPLLINLCLLLLPIYVLGWLYSSILLA